MRAGEDVSGEGEGQQEEGEGKREFQHSPEETLQFQMFRGEIGAQHWGDEEDELLVVCFLLPE